MRLEPGEQERKADQTAKRNKGVGLNIDPAEILFLFGRKIYLPFLRFKGEYSIRTIAIFRGFALCGTPYLRMKKASR